MISWAEICTDQSLNDLPYKIETNRQGQIIMSPAKGFHSRKQGRIERLLDRLMSDGEVFPECPVATSDGTKVADVAWYSAARAKTLKEADADFPTAGEIMIEILSDSNTVEEMTHQRRLYFETGASEFWVCDKSGSMRFWDATGEIPKSMICPAFPGKLE